MKHADAEVPKELRDFRNFLFLMWSFLGLPEPTPVQYEIAEYLQHGPRRRVIEAFRGAGKSYETSAYVLWCLLLNPDLKIMVVSASKERAQAFSTFCKRVMMEWPMLQHLVPEPGDDKRFSNVAFDVSLCGPDHSPSVKSVGITGQLTGSRADIIVADDIETPENSETQHKQDKIAELVKEFDSVIKPGGHIIYLGTPQIEASLYNKLPARGWDLKVWPARVPRPGTVEVKYGSNLAPSIEAQIEDPSRIWMGTDPKRFSEEDLLERELSYGPTGFALQFQLDTSLSDADRYPLKLRDLVVMDLDPELAPGRVIWASGPGQEIKDLPVVGLPGDRFFAPMEVLGEYAPYDGIVMAVDPSGKGKDETSWCVMGHKSGFLYLLDVGGSMDGYSSDTLGKLAQAAKKFGVREIICEENYGGGAFSSLLKKALVDNGYPVTVTDVRHTKAKEGRILDALEPVWTNHRLIVSKQAILDDHQSVESPEYHLNKGSYRFTWQATRMQRLKGAVKHDDRLDAVAMAAEYWGTTMVIDAKQVMEERHQEALNKELDVFYDEMDASPRKSRISLGKNNGPSWF